MKSSKYLKSGFTLIELTMAMTSSFIVMVSVALLVYSGQVNFTKVYAKNNSESQVGAVNAMAAFGAFGRKSNKMDYILYECVDDLYLKVVPVEESEELVIGDAVEFRFWDSTFAENLEKVDKHATSYALFYLEDGDLKIDYGPCPPGAINAAGQRVPAHNNEIKTVTLVRNITDVEFSHTTRNMDGDGKGCVRMKLTVTDPVTGETKTTLAATLMRNCWP